MVTAKYDLIEVLESAMNTSSQWRQRCESCSKLKTCISAWPMDGYGSYDDCLTSKELKQYVRKFYQFMNTRVKECQDFNSV